jgi:hypothetical protein
MGTYSDESPDASVGERLASSIKKTVQGLANVAAPKSITQIKSREGANEASAAGDDTTASNAGAQAQSSDNWNKY